MQLKILKIVPLLILLAVLKPLPVSAQQLDTTFGTTGGATFGLPLYSTPVPGLATAKGIRWFVRPDGSLALLVCFVRTQDLTLLGAVIFR
jgi:hypothetical protein